MKFYQSPKAALANLSDQAFKMQVSGGEILLPISCGADGNNASCTESSRGAFCSDFDSASALIFLPGTTEFSNPECVLIVNGVTGTQCQTDIDDACESGANWNVYCEDNFDCSGNIQIQCTGGFETSNCGTFG